MALHSLSICSGVGGLDLAIELACPGVFTPAALVEGEAYAAAILAARMADKALPACPIWSDVRTVCDAAFRDYVRQRTGGKGIDFVFGGIPCQPHSVAGKQLGAADPRDLWPATVRILETYKPWLFFLENVPGMLGFLSAGPIVDLRRLGYVVPRPLLLEASQVGAPQRRERLFLLAYREGGMPRRAGRGRAARYGSFADGTLADAIDNGSWDADREPGSGGRQRTADRASDVSDRQGRGEDQSDAKPGTANDSLEQPISGRRGKRKPRRGSDRRTATEQASGATGIVGDPISAIRRERNIVAGEISGPPCTDARAQAEHSARASGSDAPYWPPGPAARSEWERILAVRPDLAPAVESEIRRMATGLPAGMGEFTSTRVDELRALGNAVVPACGAAAFLILLDRLKAALEVSHV